MTGPLSRRAVLQASALTAGATLGRRAVAQGAPIRLGCIASLSGAQQIIGAPILIGAQIAAEEINRAGGVGGRMVEIVSRDDRANPNEALAAAREIVGGGVNMLLGMVTSPNALAVTAIMGPSNGILMTCAAGSDKLTHEVYNQNFFRVTDNTHMRQRAQAKLIAERYPKVLRWGAVIPDAEYGRSAWGAFRDGLVRYYPAAGGTPVIAEPVLTRFGASDYKNQIAALMALELDGLFVAVYGGDAATMFQQARPFGLQRRLQVIADSANEFIVPQALGRATPENYWTGMHWYFGGYQETPLGKSLYDAYVKRTGNAYPLGWLAEGHAAVYAYTAAITKAGSTSTPAVIAALEGLTFDSAKGKRIFRPEDHQCLCDVNIAQIGPIESDPGFKVLDFVRLDGRETVEPPAPGQPLVFGAG